MKRVKILFFIEKLQTGGAEKVLCNLVNEMDQSKFDITVQTLWKADVHGFLKKGIRYRYCYSENSILSRLHCRGEIAFGLTYLLRIRDNYDIEVAFLECGATKIMASSTNNAAKKVAWVHCDLSLKMSDADSFISKAAKWYEKYDRIVCVSQNVKESFDRLFCCSSKTLVLYNTVDDTGIRQQANCVLSEIPSKRRITVVTVGRLTHQKGYDRLLRIHKLLIGEGFSYDLWILGKGEERESLEQYIADNNLSASVSLLGFLPNPYPCILAADFLVCSSRYEGFSTFITEGMILGKAVVTTDCTGMRELLGDSKFGLITENTEEALLDGMRAMLQSEDLRNWYSAQAKERGSSFSARELTNKAEQFFIELQH